MAAYFGDCVGKDRTGRSSNLGTAQSRLYSMWDWVMWVSGQELTAGFLGEKIVGYKP